MYDHLAHTRDTRIEKSKQRNDGESLIPLAFAGSNYLQLILLLRAAQLDGQRETKAMMIGIMPAQGPCKYVLPQAE